jgi:hypothetical protein
MHRNFYQKGSHTLSGTHKLFAKHICLQYSSSHSVLSVIFLNFQVYNLHRSPYFWDQPHEFEPERFLVQKKSEGIEGWAGFDPSRSPGALYPNEVSL